MKAIKSLSVRSLTTGEYVALQDNSAQPRNVMEAFPTAVLSAASTDG